MLLVLNAVVLISMTALPVKPHFSCFRTSALMHVLLAFSNLLSISANLALQIVHSV